MPNLNPPKKYWGTKIVATSPNKKVHIAYTKDKAFAQFLKVALQNVRFHVDLEDFSKPEPKK